MHLFSWAVRIAVLRSALGEYTRAEAVADGVCVDFDVYKIRTKITESGSTVESGLYVDKRDKRSRRMRWEQLDDDLGKCSR